MSTWGKRGAFSFVSSNNNNNSETAKVTHNPRVMRFRWDDDKNELVAVPEHEITIRSLPLQKPGRKVGSSASTTLPLVIQASQPTNKPRHQQQQRKRSEKRAIDDVDDSLQQDALVDLWQQSMILTTEPPVRKRRRHGPEHEVVVDSLL